MYTYEGANRDHCGAPSGPAEGPCPLTRGTTMISIEGLIVVVAWVFSLGFGFFVVAPRASGIVLQRLGLVKVFQDGAILYAVQGPDGKPVKIPIGAKEVDGKTVVVEGYAPLGWTLPYIAGQHAILGIQNKIYGKSGKLTQQANAAALEGMPLDQAANAIALQAFAKGQYGKALMSLIAPQIQKKLQEGIRTTQVGTNQETARGGDQGGQGFNPG